MTAQNGLIIVTCWLLIAFAFTAQQVAMTAAPTDIAGLIAIFAPTLLFDALWALVTIALVVTIGRHPPGDGRTVRFVITHLLASIATALAQLYVYDRILALAGHASGMSFARLVTANLSTGIFIYWILLTIIVASLQRRRARERRRAVITLEHNLNAARAAMLRAQLQPHFLFNTLNAIAALIAEEPRTAERMVARLGDLLRLSLDEGRGATVTLAEDLHLLEAYLAIEMLRMGSRLRIIREIPPETLCARVPDLLLQPLAENAIRHGIAAMRAGGTLRIGARREGSLLLLTVSDNGTGAFVADIREGTGLRNSRERIGLVACGVVGTGLTFDSTPGAGFTVTVRLPFQAA